MSIDVATATLSYEASDPLFEHVVGLRDEAGIAIDGSQEGCALYGPYARLAAGTWRAEIHFSESPAPVGRAVMDVVVRSGNEQRGRREFDGAELDAADPVAALDFTLDQASRDLELRLFVFQGFRGRVHGMRLVPLALAPQPEAAPPSPPTGDSAWREIAIGGRSCRVTGDPRDLYFVHLEGAVAQLSPLRRLAAAVLPMDGVVVDAGANIGVAARSLAPLVPRGRIHAFEPMPAAQRYLAANVSAEPLGNIALVPLALGDRPGRLSMHVTANSSAFSSVADAANVAPQSAELVEVEVTTLDLWAAQTALARLDLMKIDVEGFEPEVLQGAARTITRFRPIIYLELNSFVLIALRNRNPRSVLEALLAQFPHVLRIDGATGAPTRITAGPSLSHFIHDHLVHRPAIDDLVCCFDDSWLGRLAP